MTRIEQNSYIFSFNLFQAIYYFNPSNWSWTFMLNNPLRFDEKNRSYMHVSLLRTAHFVNVSDFFVKSQRGVLHFWHLTTFLSFSGHLLLQSLKLILNPNTFMLNNHLLICQMISKVISKLWYQDTYGNPGNFYTKQIMVTETNI